MPAIYQEWAIKFLIQDQKSLKKERINFIEYFNGFIQLYQNDGCDQYNICQIIYQLYQGQVENSDFDLAHFGGCFRQFNLAGYYQDEQFDTLKQIKEDLSKPCSEWVKSLEKLCDKIYYQKVSGTKPRIICDYFKKILHSLDNLQPGIIDSILSDYENHILQGYGQQVSILRPQQIIEVIQNDTVKKDPLKLIALIRYAMMNRELTKEEKQNENVKQTFYNSLKLTPHHTQMITFMAIVRLSQNKSRLDSERGILAQVQTGQGKSVIIAMVAAYIYLYYEQKIDIITSNNSLAQRDYKTMQLFFGRLGIKSFYFSSTGFSNEYDVIYCTIDTILHNLHTNYRKIAHGENFETRNQECVICDEIDQFFGAKQSLNNSSGDPLSELHWIWEILFKNRNQLSPTDLKQKILDDGRYQKQLSQNAKEYVDRNILKFISNAKNFDQKYIKNVHYKFENGFIYLWSSISNTWRNNFVLKDGFQQFIELAEGCKVNQLTSFSLTQSCISYERFIQSYDRHIGLTGTIGSDEQRKELKEIYKFEAFDVPRFEGDAQDANLQILDPIIAQGMQNWIACICKEAIKASNNGQPTLIILQQQLELLEIKKALQSKIPEQSWDLIQTLEGQEGKETFQTQEKIIQQSGDIIQNKGRITIGLEIAGRGIDIKPVRQANSKGGMKVVLGFLPQNNADEVQAQGRTCRQTNNGQFIYILEQERLDEKFLTKYTSSLNFNQSLKEYRVQIEQELQKKRQDQRSYNEFIHNTCQEFFFNNLRKVNDSKKRKEIVTNWQYYYDSILNKEIALDKQQEKKIVFFSQYF